METFLTVPSGAARSNRNDLDESLLNRIMDAMSTLVELNRPNLSFKFNVISDRTTSSSILINTAENSIVYKLPCKLIEAEFKKTDQCLYPSHFYRLLRKIINLNKAYYLSLSTQLSVDEEDNEDDEITTDDPTTSCDHNHRSFSEQLTNQLIDESFDKLAKYDQYATDLVENLFDELRTDSSDFSSPLNIAIPEAQVSSSSPAKESATSVSNPASVRSSTTNSSFNPPKFGPPFFSFTSFRRHSADVEKILLRTHESYTNQKQNEDPKSNNDQPLPEVNLNSRRHSLNLAGINNPSQRRRNLSNQDDRSSVSSRVEVEEIDTSKTTPVVRSRLVLNKTKKPPVIALMLTTTKLGLDDDDDHDNEREDDDLSDTPATAVVAPCSKMFSFKSNPDLNYHHTHRSHRNHHHHHAHHFHNHNKFKQYRKVTLKNLLHKSPNQIKTDIRETCCHTGKSMVEKILVGSAFIETMADGILKSACQDASNTLNSHSKFAQELESDIFDQVYAEIKQIENLNKKLKHIFFHCECPSQMNIQSDNMNSYLTCKITVYSMIIALNESNFTNLVTFKCSHLI